MPRTSSIAISEIGFPPAARIISNNALVGASITTVLISGLVDEIEEHPLLAARQPCQLSTGVAEDKGCRRDVLRAGVHVAKQPLDRAGAHRHGSSGAVHDLGDFMTRPGYVGHRQTDVRALANRQRVP